MLASLDDEAAGWLTDLERWEKLRRGSLTRAREWIAQETGLTEGKLERVRRKRLKGIKGYVAAQIRAVYVAALEAERRRLAAALVLDRQGDAEPAPHAAREARLAGDEAGQLIDEAARRT